MIEIGSGFVVAVVAALLVIALVVALVRGVFLGYPPALLETAVLSRKEQAIVASCADALFPSGGPIPLSGTEAGLVLYMDDSLRRLPAQTRALLRLLLAFVEHGPWVFGPLAPRFSRQTHTQRIATLRRMAVSRVYFRRVAFLSLRTMLSMGYLANVAVAERIGMVPRISPFSDLPPPPPPPPVARPVELR